jgi:hypothetical protein
MKTRYQSVKVGDTICAVQTLVEWIQERRDSLYRLSKADVSWMRSYELACRMAELSIIYERLQDGRICKIGKINRRKR